jgi:hypothetical protein
MKIALRTLALTVAITGIAAGAYSSKTTTGNQVVPANAPIPNCPLNSGGCGVW